MRLEDQICYRHFDKDVLPEQDVNVYGEISVAYDSSGSSMIAH